MSKVIIFGIKDTAELANYYLKREKFSDKNLIIDNLFHSHINWPLHKKTQPVDLLDFYS